MAFEKSKRPSGKRYGRKSTDQEGPNTDKRSAKPSFVPDKAEAKEKTASPLKTEGKSLEKQNIDKKQSKGFQRPLRTKRASSADSEEDALSIWDIFDREKRARKDKKRNVPSLQRRPQKSSGEDASDAVQSYSDRLGSKGRRTLDSSISSGRRRQRSRQDDKARKTSRPSSLEMAALPMDSEESSDSKKNLSTKQIVSMAFLISACTVAYMDWYSFLSVREIVSQFYQLEGDGVIIFYGSFSFIYAVLAPVLGYIGDRTKRKTLMLYGMFIWSSANAASSLVEGTNFWIFLSLRIAFTIGQCCFCILLQSVIADMFRGNRRLRAFSLVQLSIPVGGGLGFVCGKIIPIVTGHWQHVLLYTWPLTLIFLIAIYATMTEPIRGKAERAAIVNNTGIFEDLIYLITNKTFLLGTSASICLTCVSSFAKAWLPIFMHKVNQKRNPYSKIEETMTTVSLVFTLGGMAGIILQYRLVTAIGQDSSSLEVIVAGLMCLFGAPFLYLLVMFHTFSFFSWSFFFLFSVTIVGNWAFKIDMIMSAVIPPRRTLAIGLHEFATQMLGEAISPYLIGMAGGLIHKNFELQSLWIQIRAIQNIISVPCGLCILAGGAFFFNYYFLENEKQDLAEWASNSHNQIEENDDQDPEALTEI